MPLTRHLLVTALALATLSFSPLESFAGPLQGAIHKYPPDWLTRTGPGPRRTYVGMSCGGKLLLGLGIGAGLGVGMLTVYKTRGGEIPHEAALSVPLVFGVFGTAAGYNRCR